MPDDTLHLHELDPGSLFRFKGDPRVYRLLEANDASARIEPLEQIKHRRVIVPRFGEPREFSFTANGWRRCAPMAMVAEVSS